MRKHIRMDIASYILISVGGIALAFAGLHGFENKSVTIISFGLGAVMIVVGGCLYWQDALWKKDETRSAKPVPSVTTDKSTPSPVVIRTPKSVSPKPKPIVSLSSSETDLTPSQITTKLAAASPFERDGIARALVRDVSVDWTLLFSSAKTMDADETITLAFFIDHDNKADLPTIVACTLPTEGHKGLPLKNKTALFRVRGKIVKAYMYSIDLKDASIELLHE